MRGLRLRERPSCLGIGGAGPFYFSEQKKPFKEMLTTVEQAPEIRADSLSSREADRIQSVVRSEADDKQVRCILTRLEEVRASLKRQESVERSAKWTSRCLIVGQYI